MANKKAFWIVTGTLAGVAVGAAAVYGAKKLNEYLNREEVLIRESDLYPNKTDKNKFSGGTLIDLYKEMPSDEILDELAAKSDEKFIISIHRSAHKKLNSLGLDTDYEPKTFVDDSKEKFVIFDTTYLNSEDFDIFEREDYRQDDDMDQTSLEDLIDYSDENLEETL